jgi:hypothetical protein
MTLDRNDDQIIDDLLTDFEGHDVEQLRSALLGLRAMTREPAPTPSAELAALLGGTVTALPARRRSGHHGVIFTLALVGALGVGAGTAAAVSPDFRSGAAQVISGIVSGLSLGSKPVVHPAPHPSATPTHVSGDSGQRHSTPHPTSSPTSPEQAHGGSGNSSHTRSKTHPTHPTAPPRNPHAPSKP